MSGDGRVSKLPYQYDASIRINESDQEVKKNQNLSPIDKKISNIMPCFLISFMSLVPVGIALAVTGSIKKSDALTRVGYICIGIVFAGIFSCFCCYMCENNKSVEREEYSYIPEFD